MKVAQAIGDTLRYLSEAAVRLFAPSRDEYPETGVQPFTGEPYSRWVSHSHRQNAK
jgi:hypothetical protein